jgi:hypothetical protein
MFNEILSKLPDLIQALMGQAFKTGSIHETPNMVEARNKLVSQLQSILAEISEISKQSGERPTEEQVKQIMEIPRITPTSTPWLALSKMGVK